MIANIKYLFSALLLLHAFPPLIAQNALKGDLPIREMPEFNWSSPINENEAILFEAEPIIYYHFYNNYDQKIDTLPTEGLYTYFGTHMRMYQGRSRPVNMPSYKLFIGWQRSFEFDNAQLDLAVETGHYSNGQRGCAWSDTTTDGTLACIRIAEEISDSDNLSQRLNRRDGNFSINLSRLALQYSVAPKEKETKFKHDFRFNYVLNHAALALILQYEGSAESIVDVVGEHNLELGYTFHHQTNKGYRYSFSQEVRRVLDAHPYIEPWRYEAYLRIYPKNWITAYTFGFNYGHDDYNIRIVDSGPQFSVGLSWDLNAIGKN